VSPLPLDVRTEAQARARLDAAQALEREAKAGVDAAAASLEEALRQRARAESLAVKGLISTEELELARLAAETMRVTLESARFRSEAAMHEVEVAQAALLASAATGPAPPDQECLEIRAPIDGRVLRVYEESERVVQAGTPLMELGNPSDLEIVVDLLSTDAVRVQVGAEMIIDDWGGEAPLRAIVRVVEPAGFTKTSALGVEEQRVNVIADFVDPPTSLGDGYRVETRTILWKSDSTLTIPWSALVRRGEDWGVYVVADGRATWRDVEVGHRGGVSAEIVNGLEAGIPVILHPSDRIQDGVRVSSR
jgi:HlyD family secretion protein